MKSFTLGGLDYPERRPVPDRVPHGRSSLCFMSLALDSLSAVLVIQRIITRGMHSRLVLHITAFSIA